MTNYCLEQVLSALADPTRRDVVERLSRGSASVSELARPYQMALPSFLQHVRALERCGVVRTRKEGRVRTCELNSPALKELGGWLSDVCEAWETRLTSLARYAEEQHQATKRHSAKELEEES